MLLIQQSTGQTRLIYYFLFIISFLLFHKNEKINAKVKEAKEELNELKRDHRI
ncbi:hypothetical protein [Evansella halocellulosilytica]|uniref:hypothetical protein n=1 Tax=Evansella halocellulosilytica TaxID=2011013 RepID=UPI0015C91D54|nr:hypothetical protein [Evansella halocellulosilytica]